tara:strand:- start:2268 stop:3362 length:1095 start_codon:yes stop_codon:yes gene_type:complete
MKIQEVIKILEEWAPSAYAEEYDNVGLIVGDDQKQCAGILVTIDSLEDVVDEAITKKYNLIVSFHPIIFSGIKKLTGENYVQKTIIKAIKNDIAIYAIHTALDKHRYGVNYKISEIIGLNKTQILIPEKNTLKKLITYIPENNAEALIKKLHGVGGGKIGNYEDCSFKIDGIGTYKGNEISNPYIGKKSKKQNINEVQVNMLFPKHLQNKILETLFTYHPYEEISFEIINMENYNQDIGFGMIGFLEKPLTENDFIKKIKSKMNISFVKHSRFINKKIHKVAVLGGSGSFAIMPSIKQSADALITSDLKYHDFFKAEKKILLLDIGHYESEQYTKILIMEYLNKKIPNFGVALAETTTNPVKYK